MEMNPGAAGTAYFTDGHTEVITRYHHIGGEVHFVTTSGDHYIYTQTDDLIPNDLSLLGYSIIKRPFFMKEELIFVDNPYLDAMIRGEIHHRKSVADYIEKIVLNVL